MVGLVSIIVDVIGVLFYMQAYICFMVIENVDFCWGDGGMEQEVVVFLQVSVQLF